MLDESATTTFENQESKTSPSDSTSQLETTPIPVEYPETSTAVSSNERGHEDLIEIKENYLNEPPQLNTTFESFSVMPTKLSIDNALESGPKSKTYSIFVRKSSPVLEGQSESHNETLTESTAEVQFDSIFEAASPSENSPFKSTSTSNPTVFPLPTVTCFLCDSSSSDDLRWLFDCVGVPLWMIFLFLLPVLVFMVSDH